MKMIIILLLFTIGMINSASLNVDPKCGMCKNALDWVRSNDKALSTIKNDEQMSSEIIGFIESDMPSEDICSLLSMCEVEGYDGQGGRGGNGGVHGQCGQCGGCGGRGTNGGGNGGHGGHGRNGQTGCGKCGGCNEP